MTTFAKNMLDMEQEKEKYVGEAKIRGEVKRILRYKLKADSVGTIHLKDKSVTAEKLADDIMEKLTDLFANEVIENMIGKVIADTFGNDTKKAVSQKALTSVVNDLYKEIRDLKGEPPVCLYMTATPEYFIGEEGCDINIEALSTSGKFEHVSLIAIDSKGETLIDDAENTYTLKAGIHADEDITIRCNATILGIDYEASKTIRHFTSFFIGAGRTYQDVMHTENSVPIDKERRNTCDVTCKEGDHIIIMMGESLRPMFIRADLNGMEISFTESTVTLNGNRFRVLTSEGAWSEGTYNIDING